MVLGGEDSLREEKWCQSLSKKGLVAGSVYETSMNKVWKMTEEPRDLLLVLQTV